MLRSVLSTGRFLFRRLVLFAVNMLAVPGHAKAIQSLRCAMLRVIGTSFGPETQLSERLYIYDGRHFRVGARCSLGSFCRVWDFCPISIGENLLASHGLTLISGTHLLDRERTSRPGPISIGDNVWIGINVTIVGPAAIGDNVVIGANSLVLGNLESDGVYGGSPARLLRKSLVGQK